MTISGRFKRQPEKLKLSMKKTSIIQIKNVALAAALALFGLGAISAQGQSVTYNFTDDTSDGWANAGFSGSPVASVSKIGGQN
jgi:hypothetical protein